MKHLVALFIVWLALAGLGTVNAYQARTIRQQRRLIQQMATNPACMVGR